MADRAQRQRELFEELNEPGVQKFLQAARQRRIPLTADEAKAIVAGSTARQLQGSKPQFKGRIAAASSNERWMADLADLTSTPSRPGGETHFLLVADVFSRKIWTKALDSSRPAGVLAAFRSIVEEAGPPKELNTDRGEEFVGRGMQAYLKEQGIGHRLKQAANDIAVADRASS